MYESFYGLTRTPFAVTPDPAMLFMSKVHREALATIVYGVETRKGFIVCTGEVGTGKSTIVRAFFDQTVAAETKLIYIFTPQVSPFEMARFVCRELGLDDPDSVFAAVPELQLKLLEEFECGRTVVLMVDEAQLLPPETLEFLRLLSNFETDTEKLIQIVLVGQPEVDAVLARRDMRQVNQRIALRARLAPFSIEESFEYIDHRLRVSGADELAQVMTPSAGWLIAESAGGIPRVINILADNALIAGFGMAQRPLGSQLAGATIGEFLGKSEAPRPARSERTAIGWRAARRLRGALTRDKEERQARHSAAALLAAPSAAALSPPSGRAAPEFGEARGRVSGVPRSAGKIGPEPAPALIAAQSAAGAELRLPPPDHRGAGPGVTLDPPGATERVREAAVMERPRPGTPGPGRETVEPVPQAAEADGIPQWPNGLLLVEPVADPDGWGAPSSATRLKLIEPVAAADAANATIEPAEGAPAGVNAASSPARSSRPALEANRGSGDWPALTRVRDGLRPARSEQTDAGSERAINGL
jgi:type II secretory pathway predicted ATPase ExeA